ncbi:hypothetical protein [Halalkalibacter akibai]|uniref:Lipoprotein n=1 Tax=Halalkalibacter akibai (strain ATCC 43226 / DSM 21942 / CIP 109018 / JCM 9157 / 1139) TaxID=1236973 RepID=W4QME7_HALA3|nr:hypothetical protein [Halalkalibacter akibai]GAE33295.1 hypothetical protein JCM9157_291 [Halalkalibacter akibai JCM 9157]
MKLRVLFGILLIVILTACSSTTQTVISDEVIFYGEGEYWNVSYIFNSGLYEEKKINWVEIETKGFELTQEEIENIDIEFEGRDGLITGNVGDMETKIEGNAISFLVGTVNFETYEEDEYKITINFKDKHDFIKLQIKR